MRQTARLTPQELQEALVALPQWALDEDGAAAIRRRFRFATFAEAFGFMAQLALHSERHDHHPDWSNVYNVVEVSLSTHDAGGVTQRDIAWARRADAVYHAMHAPQPSTRVA